MSMPSESAEQSSLDFQAAQQISNRIDSLRGQQVGWLKQFYNPELRCFNHDCTDSNRVSILSTCQGIFNIFHDFNLWTSDVVDGTSAFPQTTESCISLEKIRQSLADPETVHVLDNSPLGCFRIPFLAMSMMMLKTDAATPKLATSLQMTIQAVASSVGLSLDGNCEWSDFSAEPMSMYLLYWNTKTLTFALQSKDPEGKDYIQPANVGDVMNIRDKAAHTAEDNLCRQLAYHYAGDSAEFDVMQLAYALLLHHETSGARGALICGDQPSVPFNTNLALKALEVLFSQQLGNGLWPQGAPIDRTGESMRGDIGNSFVFTFDLLASLLGTIGISHPEFLRPFLPQLYKSLSWAEDNVVEMALSSYCDVNTGLTGGIVLKGWRSNHLGDGGPVMWCTSQVFLAVSRLGDLVKSLRNSDILKEFGGSFAQPIDPRPWNKLLDSQLEIGGEEASLKEVLELKVLAPLASSGQLDPLDQFSNSASAGPNPKYSLILYGPPGTAKTTICTSIAQKLGWSFLTIDTADFLSAGLQNIASRMTYIFDRLRALERTVILFDEIEEFCLDRQDKSLGMESRMLTTAMLTQLNDLRRQQKCVFLVATNRLRAFDAAVTRPGRFDMILQVGTPGLPDRLKRMQQKMQGMGLAEAMLPRFDTEKEEVAEVKAFEVASSLVTGSFEQHIRFLNFAENEAFVDEVIALVRQRKLSEESFSKLLLRAMETATIQGSVREEYLSGAKLSRS